MEKWTVKWILIEIYGEIELTQTKLCILIYSPIKQLPVSTPSDLKGSSESPARNAGIQPMNTQNLNAYLQALLNVSSGTT